MQKKQRWTTKHDLGNQDFFSNFHIKLDSKAHQVGLRSWSANFKKKPHITKKIRLLKFRRRCQELREISTSNIKYHISKIKYRCPLSCIQYTVSWSWCTDILMSVLLYISLYRCIRITSNLSMCQSVPFLCDYLSICHISHI